MTHDLSASTHPEANLTIIDSKRLAPSVLTVKVETPPTDFTIDASLFTGAEANSLVQDSSADQD